MWIKAKDGQCYNLNYAVRLGLHFTADNVWEVVLSMDPRSLCASGESPRKAHRIILYSGTSEEQARIFYARTQEKIDVASNRED